MTANMRTSSSHVLAKSNSIELRSTVTKRDNNLCTLYCVAFCVCDVPYICDVMHLQLAKCHSGLKEFRT